MASPLSATLRAIHQLRRCNGFRFKFVLLHPARQEVCEPGYFSKDAKAAIGNRGPTSPEMVMRFAKRTQEVLCFQCSSTLRPVPKRSPSSSAQVSLKMNRSFVLRKRRSTASSVPAWMCSQIGPFVVTKRQSGDEKIPAADNKGESV